MSTPFEEMTNKELKEACEDFDLKVIANNPAKPNKTEYLEALTVFQASQDSLHGRDREEEARVEAEAPAPTTKKKKVQTPSQLQKLDLMMKERVVIHDQQEAQTKDEMISVSWGNRLIGRQTDWISLTGEPQYVRRGALNNLRDATTTIHTQKPGNGGANQTRRNRFVIVSVENLSAAEIADLASQQKMRNSKLA